MEFINIEIIENTIHRYAYIIAFSKLNFYIKFHETNPDSHLSEQITCGNSIDREKKRENGREWDKGSISNLL